MARSTELLDNQNYSNAAKLPPAHPVSPATLSTVPAVGTISASMNPGVSAGMIGAAASQAAGAYPSVSQLGSGVITDPTGTINAGVGILAKTPKQLEAAGILKPGAAALITGLVQRGMDVKKAMTPNLFTGLPGAENLPSFVNNIPAQSLSQVVNLQQAQSAMMMTGAISGKEQPGLVAGIINSAAQVGAKATSAFLQTSVNVRSEPPPPPMTDGTPVINRAFGSIATGLGGAV
jgi:hypothetical protein